jgi:hypothetical protein
LLGGELLDPHVAAHGGALLAKFPLDVQRHEQVALDVLVRSKLVG